MTVRIQVCTTIEVEPSELWAALESISDHVVWMADAESITFETDQTTGVGTTFVCRTKVGPLRVDDRMTVTRWEPGAAMGIAHRGIVTGRGEFRLSASENAGTRFCWDEQLRFPPWMGGWLGERIAAPVLRRIWRSNLRRLRHMVVTG